VTNAPVEYAPLDKYFIKDGEVTVGEYTFAYSKFRLAHAKILEPIKDVFEATTVTIMLCCRLNGELLTRQDIDMLPMVTIHKLSACIMAKE